MKKFIVYGSLRPGEANYNWLSPSLRHISNSRLKGYALYDLGPYPAAVEDKDSSITVSIIEADSHAADFIELMEQGAGYHSKEVTVEGHTGTIFLFSTPQGIQIPSGDWKDRYTNRKNIIDGKD